MRLSQKMIWWVGLVSSAALLAATPSALAESGGFEIEITRPASELVEQPTIRVEGSASIFGGVRKLDLVLVIDTSKSLRKTDPKDHRSAGAIGS